MVTTTKTEKETILLGWRIAKTLTGGDIVLLAGDLGAGKTTLTKGIALGLGITQHVTSPTFLLLKTYHAKRGIVLAHIDGYRLKNPIDSASVGIDEYLNAPNTICIIEWPKRIALSKKLKNIRTIKFNHGNNETRIITY